jgi:hypothetical protein
VSHQPAPASDPRSRITAVYSEAIDVSEVATALVTLLLLVPSEQRAEVCGMIRANGIFCFECGYGSHESPNAHCQCTNDE